jgi:hypothetical protein
MALAVVMSGFTQILFYSIWITIGDEQRKHFVMQINYTKATHLSPR